MNRDKFLRHLQAYGCELLREGRGHSLWVNPANGRIEAIPRHRDIKSPLVWKICRRFEIEKPTER